MDVVYFGSREIYPDFETAIAREDADDAGKWIAAQDKLTKQILTLGAELGITPKARRDRGLGRR